MYKIKQVPEDFIVKEISNIQIKKTGKYSYWILKKKDYTTSKAAEKIANALRIPLNHIGYAGNKDRRAVTEQLISIYITQKERLERIKLADIELKFLGYGDERINLGGLKGNRFEITVRNLRKEKLKKIPVPNYFDEQRFSKNNVEIGRAIVKKDFRKAANMIDDARVKDSLKTNPNDSVGAIRLLPIKLVKLYVHAYQSYLWNKTAAEYLKKFRHKKLKISSGELIFPIERVRQKKWPIPGFGTWAESDITKKENLKATDFIIRAIPELSSEGGHRNLMMEINYLKISRPQKDELNKGKKKIKLSFTLGKGSYATMVVKAFTVSHS